MLVIRHKPVSDQVRALLRKNIHEKVYGNEGKLPSETSLAEEFQVSRSTIRSALASLEEESLIIRKTGDGTYINSRILDLSPNFGSFWEYTSLIESGGRKVSVNPISLSKRCAFETEEKALGLQSGEQVHSLTRLFLADNKPVIYSVNVIPASLIQKEFNISETDIEISKFIGDFCNQELYYVITDIGAIMPNKDATIALQIGAENLPILHLIEIFYNKESLPIVYADNYLNDKSMRLRFSKKIN